MKSLLKYRSILIIILSSIISVVMVYLIMLNYSDFSETLIRNEQRRLLAVADAIARSIEENVNSNEEYMRIVKEDVIFTTSVEEIQNADNDDERLTLKNELNTQLERFMGINNTGVVELSVYDSELTLISQYPKNQNPVLTDSEIDEVKHVKDTLSSLVGGVVFPASQPPYFSIYMPIKRDDGFTGVLSGKISTDYIYDKLVQPVELGIIGYASVKTNETRLLMHPSVDDIGRILMEVRRERFPQHDWSELERVVNEQLENGRGVSIYHSVWANDASGQRVKKFSAYSSAYMDDHFWIVTISADYNQIIEIIRKNYYITLVTAAMIFFAVVFSIISILKMRHRQKAFDESIKHNEELANLNMELAKMLNRYSAIFDNTMDCVFIMDFTGNRLGKIVEQNKKSHEVYGYNDARLRTLSLNDLERDEQSIQLEDQLATLELGQSMLYETALTSENGEEIAVEAHCSLFELEGKKRLLYIARDITQRLQEEQILIRSERRFMSIVNELATRIKEEKLNLPDFHVEQEDDKESTYATTQSLHRKLEKINIQLEYMFKSELEENRKNERLLLMQSKSAAMGEMIGNIAHQWRQPLNTLNFILMNLQDGLEEKEPDKETMDVIHQKIDKGFSIIKKMSETIDDFRNFFKPQDIRKPFKVRETIEHSLMLFEERIRLNAIRIRWHHEEDLVCHGYSGHFSQIVINLINNSIDAYKSGDNVIASPETDRSIDIEFRNEGEYIVIHVSDHAGGIAEEILDNIFDPYFTTKDMQNGTGLGLYMSKTIAEKHFGGSLYAENRDGGVRFTMMLKQNMENEDGRQ